MVLASTEYRFDDSLGFVDQNLFLSIFQQGLQLEAV